MPRWTPLVLSALLAAFARAAGAAEPPKPRPPASREEIEAVEATVARAVDRVSLPHAARLLGRIESARGYRLPGYGVVVVLTPRTLPGGEGQIFVVRHAPKRRLRTVTPHAGTGEAPAADEEAIETFERQVLVLQQETEEARRAAEEEAERILHDVRVRVATPDVHVEMVPPPPPEPPSTPAAAAPAAPPPWKFWFETQTQQEKRTPEAVIADVRGALVDALASGVHVAGLAAEERVTVTVDFVPGGLFAASARPHRTLVVSARARDVSARARGAITPDELSRRVEVTEY
ncbi:MAG TPA: hypothetical protein VLL75_09080 [Vicinamibacteria bacterium]|jgi:hypothetical protein|nr:hypothetical protein [Vicinamibacteria bacterium]